MLSLQYNVVPEPTKWQRHWVLEAWNGMHTESTGRTASSLGSKLLKMVPFFVWDVFIICKEDIWPHVWVSFGNIKTRLNSELERNFWPVSTLCFPPLLLDLCFPEMTMFAHTQQCMSTGIQRLSGIVPAIAEGHPRNGNKETAVKRTIALSSWIQTEINGIYAHRD